MKSPAGGASAWPSSQTVVSTGPAVRRRPQLASAGLADRGCHRRLPGIRDFHSAGSTAGLVLPRQGEFAEAEEALNLRHQRRQLFEPHHDDIDPLVALLGPAPLPE